jgi:hypothetical protein
MAIVGLLAIALARPVFRGSGAGDSPVSAVLVIDRSYSMAFEEAGRSRLDKAKETALQVLGTLQPGDEAALVLLGESLEVRTPTADLQAIGREISDLQISHGAADLAAGLLEARTILNESSSAYRELYIVCDRQSLSWRGVPSLGDSIKTWASQVRRPMRFYVLPVGNEDSENIAIESADLSEGFAVRGQVTDVEVRLRNYADVMRAGIELELHHIGPGDAPRRGGVAGRPLKAAAVTIGPRSSATVKLPVTFEQPGSHVIRVIARSPGLEVDNQLEAAIDVIEPIRVLIVSGDERADEMRRESFFLKTALMPFAGGKSSPFAVTVSDTERWSSLDLEGFQVIALVNVPEVLPEQARRLDERVYEGGGLIICPGGLASTENYNAVLHRDGLGLMPAALSPPSNDGELSGTTIQGIEVAHPIFRFARGTEVSPSASVGRHFTVDISQGDGKAIAHYSSGEPFLIEAPRGRGRVLLLTTPLDADWSTLPLSPFYLPFVQSLVKYAAGPRDAPRNLGLGEPIVAAVDENAAEVVLMRMEEAQNLLSGVVAGGVRFTRTQRPGIYRLAWRARGQGLEVAHYVVRAPREESDLACLTDEQWAQHQRQLGFARIESSAEDVAAYLARQRRGTELWLPILAIVMTLGIGETWLARRWAAWI